MRGEYEKEERLRKETKRELIFKSNIIIRTKTKCNVTNCSKEVKRIIQYGAVRA
jgi:hypothetical protein